MNKAKCKCGADWCPVCNPVDGPIPNDGVQSGLAVREKLGPDNGGTNKVKLNKDDEVFDHDERNSGHSGPVF